MNYTMTEAQFRVFFNQHARTGYAQLKGSKTKGSNFDPNRNTNYTIVKKNPIPVKLLYRPISASSLTYRELGLSETGAIEILVRNNDISLIKLAENIKVKNNNYVAWNNKVGNKFQLYESQFSGFSKIVIFLRVN